MITNGRRLLPRCFQTLWIVLGSVGAALAVAQALRARTQHDEIEVREQAGNSVAEQRSGAHETAKNGRLDNRSRPDAPILRNIPAEDLDVTGQWTGFQEFWHCSSLIVKRDAGGPGRYRLLFVRDTDLGVWQVKRTAKLANGILTLNKPVREVGFAPTKSPNRALYAVRTTRGEFLLPAVNAESMRSVNDLMPGFAYQRSEKNAADDALNRVPMGSQFDESIEQFAELLTLAVRTKLKSVPLLFELSFGPACWLASTNYANSTPIAAVYEPLVRIALQGNGFYGRSLRLYANALSDSGRGFNGLLLMAMALIPDEVLPVDTYRSE